MLPLSNPQPVVTALPPVTAAPVQRPIDPRARDPRTIRNAAPPPDPIQASVAANTSGGLPSEGPNEMEFRSMVAQQIQMANEMAAAQQQHPSGIHHSEDLDMRSPIQDRYETQQRPAIGPYDTYGRHSESNSPPYKEGRGRRGGGVHCPPRSRGGGGRGASRPSNYTAMNTRANRYDEDTLPPTRRHRHAEERWQDGGAEARGQFSSSTSPRDTTTTSVSNSPRELESTTASTPMTLREKRKNNEYESPLSRTSRF